VKIDLMFYALTGFLFLFTVAILGAFLYLGLRYRQRPGSQRRSVHVEAPILEYTWTAIPTVIALMIFVAGAVTYYDFATVPDNAMEISVVGKQWMWHVQHPNGKREVNQLTVPIGEPVRLVMRSQDVIHSFYVPAFRIKQDLLPARWSTMWFEATMTGEFPFFCAEYCGTDHSTMIGTVRVLERQAYETWLADVPAGETTPVERGESLFTQMGCATCHLGQDDRRGPDLRGIYGSTVQLQTGESLVADEEYLRESIMSPTSQITAGYAPLMPSYEGLLQDEDVFNLVAYIKTLNKDGQ